MATRTDRFLRAAVLAARRAKQWTVAAAQAADRLLIEVRHRAESADRQRRLRRTLRQTGRVLKAAGQAALIAGLAAGVAAVRTERADGRLPRRRDAA